MTDFVAAIVRFAAANADLIYAIAFLATCLESVIAVGFLIPGSSILVALAALIPSGAVEFWWLCLWSVVGAIIGDSISYWVGLRYSDRLKRWWPLRNHPDVLAGGERFFAKHGGKSVFLARFVPPVRGTVPFVAGMARLAANRFFVVNVLSALGWAPLHVALGALIGAGLVLTGAVATRLLILVVVVAAVLWLAAALAVFAARRGWRFTSTVHERLDRWAHGRQGWLPNQVRALLDPERGEARALAFFGLVLVAAAWTFFGVLEDVLTGDPLVRADSAIYNVLQGLRSHLADQVMIAITELGGSTVIGAVSAAVLIWLIWRRAWHAAVYWIAAIGGSSIIAVAVKAALHRPRPTAIYSGWESFSFPSGHATASAVMFGFLGMLLARDARPAGRILTAVMVVLVVVSIGFSRLYLGAHWFSDVVGGIAFGTAWVALLSIAYVRHDPPDLPKLPLAAIVIATFVGVGAVQIVHKMPADLERYAARHPVRTMTAKFWWRDGWRQIPLWRFDLKGEREEPLVLQWAGDLKDLQNRLLTGGWRLPRAWSIATAESWLSPDADPMSIPVLPRLHDGRSAALTMIHPNGVDAHPDKRWVLRIWRAGTTLTNPDGSRLSLWVGGISTQHFRRALAPFDIGFENSPAKTPWPLLDRPLGSAQTAMRTDSGTGDRVLLAQD